MMFSFLETIRLQGKNAVDELFNLLTFGHSLDLEHTGAQVPRLSRYLSLFYQGFWVKDPPGYSIPWRVNSDLSKQKQEKSA